MYCLMSWEWWKAASVRCIKTAAQTAVALIGTNQIGITAIDWMAVISATALTAVVSFLTSLAGLPEVSTDKQENVTNPPKEEG